MIQEELDEFSSYDFSKKNLANFLIAFDSPLSATGTEVACKNLSAKNLRAPVDDASVPPRVDERRDDLPPLRSNR